MGTPCLSLLLPLVLGLQLTAAGSPLYGAISRSDLADLETLVERLEDRLPDEQGLGLSQGAMGQSYETGEVSNPRSSLDGDVIRPQLESSQTRGSWELPDKTTPIRNRLRELLNSPRSFRRSSDCFGGKIDKIGAQSGMGCNNHWK
ncbi:natriuretic peptides A [Lissotriton helveticus]